MYVCLWAYTCVFCRCTRLRCTTLVSHRSRPRRCRRRRIVVAFVVVPLLIIRMMGRHTLELKLRDVSSAGELRASTTPRSCRLLNVHKRSYERGAALYTRLQLVERDCENTLADNTAERIGTLREILCQVSGIRGSRCRSRARGWREIVLRDKSSKATLSD